MNKELNPGWIAGFWRRIGALFIDLLLLALVSVMFGEIFESMLAKINLWGIFVGFLLALLYFGIMNSKYFCGQTIGKTLLNLKVVDSNNASISIGKSFSRAFILTAPFALAEVPFSGEIAESFFIYPLHLIIYGAMASIFYLYFFNRSTRQSLHDLLVGTFVVNEREVKTETTKIWNIHLIAISIIFVVSAMIPFFIKRSIEPEILKRLLATQTAIMNLPNVSYASVISSNHTSFSATKGNSSTTSVTVHAVLNSKGFNSEVLGRDLALLLVENYPDAKNKDYIKVTLSYGYNIGLWSKWYNYPKVFDPRDICDNGLGFNYRRGCGN